MICCPTWRHSRPARRDDPDRAGPGHCVPDAHAEVGHGAHQRRGAAAHGGRANRPGTPALYLALEPETAIREYQQLSPLMPPGTLVNYTVHIASIVDFRAGYDTEHWSELWEEFANGR